MFNQYWYQEAGKYFACIQAAAGARSLFNDFEQMSAISIGMLNGFEGVALELYWVSVSWTKLKEGKGGADPCKLAKDVDQFLVKIIFLLFFSMAYHHLMWQQNWFGRSEGFLCWFVEDSIKVKGFTVSTFNQGLKICLPL